MEREKEIEKLVNVLRRTARMAMQSEWTGSGQDAAAFCVEHYNRVLARLKEIDAGVGAVFDALPAGSTLTVAAMACRQLAAYYEDEVPSARSGKAYGVAFDPEQFRSFWHKSAREIEDLGEFIRESVEEWARCRKGETRQQRQAKTEPQTKE
jgi:hypothetical protein